MTNTNIRDMVDLLADNIILIKDIEKDPNKLNLFIYILQNLHDEFVKSTNHKETLTTFDIYKSYYNLYL